MFKELQEISHSMHSGKKFDGKQAVTPKAIGQVTSLD
jgi:hypothetical protein